MPTFSLNVLVTTRVQPAGGPPGSGVGHRLSPGTAATAAVGWGVAAGVGAVVAVGSELAGATAVAVGVASGVCGWAVGDTSALAPAPDTGCGVCSPAESPVAIGMAVDLGAPLSTPRTATERIRGSTSAGTLSRADPADADSGDRSSSRPS
jgi:hypothetical protein